MNVTILILWCGERQIYDLLKEIDNFSRNYSYSIKVKVIAYYENHLAHNLLYKQINEDDGIKIKIDGDMNIHSMEFFVKTIESLKDKKIILQYVFDSITSKNIMGVHYFGKSIKIDFANTAPLFPDKYIISQGEIIVSNDIAIIHCRNPSRLQIYTFLIHRFKKMLRADNRAKIGYFKIILNGLINNIQMIPCIFLFIVSQLRVSNYKRKMIYSNDRIQKIRKLHIEIDKINKEVEFNVDIAD